MVPFSRMGRTMMRMGFFCRKERMKRLRCEKSLVLLLRLWSELLGLCRLKGDLHG